MKVDEKAFEELNVDNAMEHIHWLTENAPNRISAMGDDVKAAKYVMEKLKEYGWETNAHEYMAYNSWPESASLEVLSPEKKTIKANPCCHIVQTPPEGIEVELVYLGPGAESNYEGKDVKGKLVLVEVSYAPSTPEKARIAARKGALGLVCMNWGREQPVICMRALKAVWGIPTEDNFNDIPQVTGISISRTDGEYLIELLSKNQTVKVNIKSRATRQWDKLIQPYGILEGTGNTKEFLLVSAHIDAWSPGVTCNATGNSTVLELARVLSRHRNELKRNIRIEFWNGHEIAEAAGSTWLVDNYWDDIRENCIGYVNIDSSGMKDAARWTAIVSRELMDCVANVISKRLDIAPEVNPLGKLGDQSFFGMGIPAIAGRVNFDKSVIEYNHGATLGWWNHTRADGIDKADPEHLAIDLKMDLAIITTLVNADVLPYDFTRTCKDITEKLRSLEEDTKEVADLIDIASLRQAAEALLSLWGELAVKIKTAQFSAGEANCINRALMDVSRALTSTFYTYASRYEQDSYGLSILSKPIPLIYRTRELIGKDRKSQEFNLLLTTMIKNRNRVSDALYEAKRTIQMVL